MEEGDNASDQPGGDIDEPDSSDKNDGEGEGDTPPSDETEDGSDEQVPSDQPDGDEEGDSSDALPGEESDESAEDSSDDASEKDGAENKTTGTVSSNDLLGPKAASVMEAKAGEVTEISYEEASGNGVQVTASHGSENAARYAFTVPVSGRYVFYTEEKASSYTYFQIYDEQFDAIKYNGSFSSYQYLSVKTDYLNQGDRLYIETYTNNTQGETFTLKVAGETSLTKAEDGSYNAALPDGAVVNVSAEAGYKRLKFEAQKTSGSGSYNIKPYYCPADHSSEDRSWTSTYIGTSKSSVLSGTLAMGKTYETVFVITQGSYPEKFLALFSGMDALTTKISDADREVYIHENVLEDHRIILDIEVAGTNSLNLYYFPEEDPASKTQAIVSGWGEQIFSNLKAGTKYIFEFRDSSDNELLYTTEYETTGAKVEASTSESSAIISDDFATMLIKTKPQYNGTAAYAYLAYKFKDSMNRVIDQKRYMELPKQDSDPSLSVEIDLMQNGVFLRPGEEYQLEFYLEFSEDNVTSLPEVITVNAPAKASVDPEQVTFAVAQDETTKTRVNYTVGVADAADSQAVNAVIFYKPSGTQKYLFRSVAVYNGSANGSIDDMSAGVEYDFLLYVGGATKEQTLKLETVSGRSLTRVEDSTTDYVGPYDLVRTYRMETTEGVEPPVGSYYLRLQYLDEYGNYNNIGSSVELNADNGYQATVSTAERWNTWMKPDTDYTLRWMLGKTSVVYESNAECSIYETVRTSTANVTLESVATLCNYQEYKATLDADDVVNMKANGRGIYLYDYLKAENTAEYTSDSSYYFSSGNNYSATIALADLTADTSYELSLRYNSEVEYAKATFTTSSDQRTVKVASVNPFVVYATIEYSTSGFGEKTKDNILCYYREVKPDNSEAWILSNSRSAAELNYRKFDLYDLKENTDYEYTIGIGNSYDTAVSKLQHPVTGSFKTKADESEISISATKVMMTSARLEYVLYNTEYAGYDNIYAYIRTNQNGEVGKWELKSKKSIYNTSGTIELNGLQEKTSYEYKLGLGKNNASVGTIKRTVEGTFTTYADTRKLEITGSTPRTLSANIAYTLSGMEYAGDGYLIGYAKKKVDPENAWSMKFSQPIGDQDTSGTVSVTRLEEKTEYDFTMGFGDSNYTGKNELKHPQTVTFTTLEDQRKVSNPKASVKGTSAVLSALFEGNIEYTQSYVHFYYRRKGTSEYTKVARAVNATRVKTKECSVTVTGLSKGTVYEFVAVLSEDQSWCDVPDEVTKPEYKTELGEFEIASGSTTVVNPTSVNLSQTKLFLNANASYSGVRGYGYETLKATVNPANAAAGFTWESSDENIVTVSGGRVTAVTSGTATVTVTSAYNASVSAVCEVVVGNYQLAKKDTAGMELLGQPALNAVKGGEYSGYTVCKIENDSTTEVRFNVSSDNEAVALWNEGEGKIKVNGIGSTKLVFTTEDKVKLYLQVAAGSAPGKGFAVTGFTAADGYEAYAAVQNAENEYTLAYTPGISYSTQGEIVPKNPVFDESDFNWTIDKTDVATVDEWGNITPLKAGYAVLRVTPKEAGDALYTKDTCEVTLHIKSLASAELENATPVYALADISSKIGDVKFPAEEAWKGWQWKEPDTPLVINGVNKEYYPFEAVYTGNDHYPEEKTVNVYIAKVTGVTVYEDAEIGHNQVVEVGSVDAEKNPTIDSDSIMLTVESLYYGSLNCNEETNYYYDVDIEAPVDVVVKKHDFTTDTGKILRTFSITATKQGSYTLTPVIRAKDKNGSNEKVLAKTTYKIKAVEDNQAYIRLKLEEPAPDGVLLDGDMLIVDHDKKADVVSFRVKAELFDRNQANAANFDATKIVWNMSDKKVATVKASSDTHSAEVMIVGEGHTILTAKVKDTAGHKAELKVEIQNHAPRVDRANAKVNLAYDYDSYSGLYLASWMSGAVEVVPVYGEGIQKVSLYADADATRPYTGLKVVRGNEQHSWIICPTAETKTGEGSYYLGVKTSFRDALYIYPLKVTVVDQQATVTARSIRPSNLFYRSDPGSLDITVKGSYYSIDSVKWTDSAGGDNNGFDSEGTRFYSYDNTKKTKGATRYYFTQEDIQLTADRKLVDTGIVNGTIEVQLGGYKKPNVVNASLKWNYKKPSVNTVNSSVTLIPAVPGKKSGYFRLYNKTEGRYLNYRADSYSGSDPKYYYNELVCSNDDVRFGSNGSTSYTYTGSKTSGSEKVTVTISGDDWRESLNATHTIKLASPVPYLTSTKLTMNTNRVGAVYTYICLKNAYASSLSCADIIIQGKDAKAQKLLDEDLLEIRQDSSDASRILVTENRASTMKQSAIANGTYSYTVIPCYVDADGNRIESKKLSLKIAVTDKEITAKTKATRSLDLTKAVDDFGTNGNNIRLDTTFKNIGNYYEVIDSELIGEYSEYFNLHYNDRNYDQRLTIANESELKAGQKYKLAIRFTLKMREGDIFTVTGAPFTVKPKQTAAKIKIYGNNQTLYAAAQEVSRMYELQTTYGSDYRILNVSGSLDCNKDGKADITVSYQNALNSNYYVYANVQIVDRDGVLTVTGAKGKTYTIPVTVQLRGRDGITKDVKTSIKVTVKR